MRKIITLTCFFILFLTFFRSNSGFALEESRYTISDNFQILPYESIFKQLMADPASPRMGAGYTNYTSATLSMRNALDFSIGGIIPLVRINIGDIKVEAGAMGLGLLGFDLDRLTDEVYSDFYLGMPIFVQLTDKFMFMIRCYHRSSHIGDETIMNRSESEVILDPDDPANSSSRINWIVERINLSYILFDTLLFYQINSIFRIYGGGGWVSDPDPYRYGASVYQIGAEANCLFSESIGASFFSAVDLKGTSMIAPGVSVKTGVKFFDKIAFLFNFYDGYGPAQFFDQRITSYGVAFDILM
ncbi:MAG: DUF1207 domain-containing protein [Deferribacteraceae bacterium]|nr:DUF1207 domain-containing protein [Deferribacteraceae bacterium]